jgi:hypothetical protein
MKSIIETAPRAAFAAGRITHRIIAAGAAALLIVLALGPARALGPTAGTPSASSLHILEEAQSGKSLSERFNLPRSPVQLGLPRFDGEPAPRPGQPGAERR